MKKNIYILLALLLGLSLTTCKKDAVPDKLTVNAEVKEVTTNSVIIEGSYEYSMEITEFEMFYSTTDDMNGSQSVKITPEGNDFSVELTGLEDNTQYYFNFVFTGEYNSTTTEEVCDFKTLEVKTPTLTTNNISNIMETTAECGGNVTDDGGGTVTERGICWSTSHYPSVMDNRTKNGGGTGAFTAKMTNLKPNTKYYVRAYATNEKGTNYGAEKGFTTKDVVVELPTVTTKTVSEITATTAKSGGNVTDDGGGTVTARGVCWSSTSSSPKVNDSHTIDGKGTGSFNSTLTDLKPNTTYYVRAYAINEKGTVYGPLKSFTTLDDGSISVTEPTVTTRNVTAITANSATCGGTVTDEGGATVTARGVCWGISSNPTINNLYDETTVDGDGAGSFISQLTNLKENTTYYVRAYATNNVGTSYGEEFTFTTLQEEGWQEPTGSIDGYDYVDLGLPSGLKWATCNIGANSPGEYGNYYAWGETTTKSEYTKENCLTYFKVMNDISGNIQYDAATANWSGNWRMPTKEEIQELIDNCTWELVVRNGINVYNVKGSNGNSIFLPKEDYYNSNYWSSTPHLTTGTGWILDINYTPDKSFEYRYYRGMIRPVSGGNFTGPEEQPIIQENIYIETITGEENGHAYVDLGLSSGLMWATYNIGANTATEYGDYYAWGEIETKSEYTVENSLTYGKQMDDISANPQYDAATANWGGKWRMPKKSEMQELIRDCTWTWIIQDGINGYMVTGPNSNSIFLPAAGWLSGVLSHYKGMYCGYWTSMPDYDQESAIRLLSDYEHVGLGNEYTRDFGHSIRPVFDGNFAEPTGSINGYDYIDLGLPSGLKWATCNVGANNPEDYGNYYAWGETETKPIYHDTTSVTHGLIISELLSQGYIDGNNKLTSQHDAATANWGGTWRLPTKEELEELKNECTWTWTTQGGNNGYKVTGPNGNHIFLPAAGYRYGSSPYFAGERSYYWSSTPEENYDYAYYLYFDSSSRTVDWFIRYYGRSVRPVSE